MNTRDAILIAQNIAQAITFMQDQKVIADANLDGDIGVADILLMLKAMLGVEALPVSSPQVIDGITYNVFHGHVQVALSEAGIAEASVRQSIGVHPVTELGAEAFKDQSVLTKVTLPDSITAIGERAFSGCILLQEIVSGEQAPACSSLSSGAVAITVSLSSSPQSLKYLLLVKRMLPCS